MEIVFLIRKEKKDEMKSGGTWRKKWSRTRRNDMRRKISGRKVKKRKKNMARTKRCQTNKKNLTEKAEHFFIGLHNNRIIR